VGAGILGLIPLQASLTARRGPLVAVAAAGGCRWDDLGEALADGGSAEDERRGPWRVHFHVPLHAEPQPPLATTRDVLLGTLRALAGGETARTDHLEVETYTWNVLPAGHRAERDLAAGIAAELAWTRDRLLDLGLQEVPAVTERSEGIGGTARLVTPSTKEGS
jgi:hypothetical protein